MTHPGGRPRTLTPSDEDLIKLGEEMLEWVDSQENILHLSEWYTIHKKFTYCQWKAIIQKPQFVPYYDEALRKVGLQYLRKDSPVEPSLKQRWQRVYFKDLKEQEDQDKDDDIKRQSTLASQAGAEYEDKLMKIAAQLQAAREAFSNKPKED